MNPASYACALVMSAVIGAIIELGEYGLAAFAVGLLLTNLVAEIKAGRK